MARNLMPTIGALGAGAALMYLLDPARGKRRRHLIRDQMIHVWHETSDAVETGARDLANRTKGVVAESRHLLRRPFVDDDTLCARVRSHLGHVVSHSHAVVVTAEDGVVTLGGPILASEVRKALDRASSVEGVQDVVNRLEVHDGPDVSALMGGRDRPDRSNGRMTPAGRLVTSALGGAMTAYGAARRDKVGATVGLTGVGMLARGISSRTR